LHSASRGSLLLHFNHDFNHIQQSTILVSTDSIVHSIRFRLLNGIILEIRLILDAAISMFELIKKENTTARAQA
jgi:hypothetical protein